MVIFVDKLQILLDVVIKAYPIYTVKLQGDQTIHLLVSEPDSDLKPMRMHRNALRGFVEIAGEHASVLVTKLPEFDVMILAETGNQGHRRTS